MSTQPTAPATPRTDALRAVPMTRADSDDFARTLETELTAAQAALAVANEVIRKGSEDALLMRDDFLQQLAAAKADAARLQMELAPSVCAEQHRQVKARAERAEADNAKLRADVERLNKGLRTIRDSCENCTNGSDLRAEAASIIGQNQDKRLLLFHSEYYNCDRFSRIEKERDQLRARVGELEQDVAALHAEAEEAKKQQRLAWERHAEKDRAYGEALAERDAAIKARDNYGLIAAKTAAEMFAARADTERLEHIWNRKLTLSHVWTETEGSEWIVAGHRGDTPRAAIDAARGKGAT